MIELKNGDILGVYEKSFLSFFTKIAQKLGGYGTLSSITHIGVACQHNGLWYSQEMDGRHNVLRPLSQYLKLGTRISVYRADGVNSDPDFAIPVLNNFMAIPITYNIIDLFKIGFHVIFRFKRNGTADNDSMVCCSYGAAINQALGWVPPPALNKMPAPAELCSALKLIGDL